MAVRLGPSGPQTVRGGVEGARQDFINRYGGGGGEMSIDVEASQRAIAQRQALAEEQARQQAEAKRLAELKATQEAQAQAELQQRIITTKQQAESVQQKQTAEGDIVTFYNQPGGSGYLQEIQNKRTGQVTYRTVEGGRAGTTFTPEIKEEVTSTVPIQSQYTVLQTSGGIVPGGVTSLRYSLGIESAREQFLTTKGTPAQSIKPKATIGSFIFGETGEKLLGIGGMPGQLPAITFKEIQTGLRKVPGKAGYPVRVASYLIPTTVFDVALTAGGIAAFKFAPPIIKLGTSAYTSYAGGKVALTSGLPSEQRVAGGVIGGLGTLGSVYEVSPYVKGVTAKLSPGYKPVITKGRTQIITEIPRTTEGTFNLKLIPPGKSAYGYSRFEQLSYVNKVGDVTTSARELVQLPQRVGFGKTVTSREVGPSFYGGQEEFGLFATPFDIKTGIAQTRISRLGTQNVGELFKIQKNVEVSFRLTRESPQFVVFEQASITRTGLPGTFKAGGKLSSELEVTAVPGSKISSIRKVGVTTIGGQKVDIFSAKLSGGVNKGLSLSQISKAGLRTSSTAPSKRVSGLGMLSLVSASSYEPAKAISIPVLSKSLMSSSSVRNTMSSAPSLRVSSYSSGISGGTPGVVSTPVRQPTRISTPTLRTTQPRTTPSATRITRTPQRLSLLNYPTQPTKIPKYYYRQPLKLSTPTYGVSVRRRGKWKLYGKSTSLAGAFGLGKKYTLGSLGASFKVEGVGRIPGAPKGYYAKQEKGQQIFIQKRSGRLSSLGEKMEIKSYARSKRKKRKGDLF